MDAGQPPGLIALSAGHPERDGVDVILRPDGAVEEAVLESHGAGMLQLDRIERLAGEEVLMASLYTAGVRLAVLDATAEEAATFLARGLIDRVVAYVPIQPSSSTAVGTRPPSGFHLAAVHRQGAFVRVAYVSSALAVTLDAPE
jgi:riboflavin biosynthesis pyrimidine reductase